MRRLLSLLLLGLGVANLVWLNRELYPRYQATQQGILAQDGKIELRWLMPQLSDQAPLLVVTFEEAGYLPKTSLAQLRQFALDLARGSGNYWVQLRVHADPALEAALATEQQQGRARFVKDLLVQSGLDAQRVLVDAKSPGLAPTQKLMGTNSPRRVEIRVLEVQSQ